MGSANVCLSSTDTHQILWRRLVLQARGMMQPQEVEALPPTEAEQFSATLKAPEQTPG